MAALIDHVDSPLLCSECLGGSTTHLIRDSAGSECRLCTRPFVTFKWKKQSITTKHTVICGSCAETNQICQSCLLDFEFHISMALRDTALRIMAEEGGTEEDRKDVLDAIAAAFATTNKSHTIEQRSEQQQDTPSTNLNAVISRFPLPGPDRPQGCCTLCVYGIESDLDSDILRSYFKSPIDRIEYVPAGRYAFFTFASESDLPIISGIETILDGRRLMFAWGHRVAVAPEMQPAIGAVIRAYLRRTLSVPSSSPSS